MAEIKARWTTGENEH